MANKTVTAVIRTGIIGAYSQKKALFQAEMLHFYKKMRKKEKHSLHFIIVCYNGGTKEYCNEKIEAQLSSVGAAEKGLHGPLPLPKGIAAEEKIVCTSSLGKRRISV